MPGRESLIDLHVVFSDREGLQKQMKKTAAVLGFASLAIVAILYWQQGRPRRLIVSGFVEADEIRVGSQVGGRVAQVLVEEGDRVRRGELIFNLEPFDLAEQHAAAAAELAAAEAEHARLSAGYRKEEIEQAAARQDAAKAELDRLQAGPRRQEISIAREQMNTAQARLEFADSEFARLEQLRKDGKAAPREYERAASDLKAARAEAAAAAQNLALLEEGSRKEDIAAAAAALAEAAEALKLAREGFRAEDIAKAAAQEAAARARVAAITARMEELAVESPCDCTVEAIDLLPGDLIGPNAPSVSLLDTSRLWVRGYVPESRLGEIRLGQRVPVRVEGLSRENFAGRISFIATQAEFTPRNVQTPEERSKQVFRIKVRLETGRDKLRVGMTADLLLDEAAP